MRQVLGILILIIVFVGIVMAVRPTRPLSDFVGGFNTDKYAFNLPGTTGTAGGTNLPRGTVSSGSGYAYQLSDTTPRASMDPFGKIYYNATLLRIYGDGRREVVIENMRNRFSNILLDANQKLVEYYFPRNSDVIYFDFRDYYTQGTKDRHHVYKYNVRTDTMTDLSSNRYLMSYVVPSPRNPLVAIAVDDNTLISFQRLYLVNLETDSARLVYQLGGNETLASSVDATGKFYGVNINWVDANTIQFSIYRNSYQPGTKFVFLGNKTLSL
jgi:hypothetical protein